MPVIFMFQMDICAILLEVTLICTMFARPSYLTPTARIGRMMVALNLTAAVFDLISAFSISYPSICPVPVHYLINIAFYLAFNLQFVSLFFYMLVQVRRKKPKKPELLYAAFVVSSLLFLLLTTPLTKWIIYIGEDGSYNKGPLNILIYIISLSQLGHIIVLFARHRKEFPERVLKQLIFFVVIILATVAYQGIFPTHLVGPFVVSLIHVGVYYLLENPADYMYLDTYCFNTLAFTQYVKKHIDRSHSFDVVALQLRDADYLRSQRGTSLMHEADKQIIDLLTGSFGQKHVFALGTDHFCVLLDDRSCTVPQAKSRIRELLKHPLRFPEGDLPLDVSFVTLSYPNSAETADRFLSLLSYSLQSANHSSDDPTTGETVLPLLQKEREDAVLHALRDAVRQHSFQVYFQPIVDAATGKCTHAEAVARLTDPTLGSISPDEFIPIAEHTGLIIDIGEQIFEEVCRFFREGRLQELGLECLEVNLSTVQCAKESLPNDLLSIMEKYGIPASRINFEITETAAIARMNTLLHSINTLRARGVTFSIDDYGTGYSSVTTILKLPVDIIKVDKSLLWTGMKDERAWALLKNSIRMFHDLSMKVVVEGIETEEMADSLRRVGCDLFQGYYYARPLPEDEFLSYLQSHRAQ